ncbi:MAG: cyclic nucleotide-binding domain-containing protein [Proteobacteria bacterium]|nr:cyclic nucleotide-binding domain-containing protein [Pseudomonadota bacterium]
MPSGSQNLCIEDFRPRLKAEVEWFDLPDGDLGMYRSVDGVYIRIPRVHAALLKQMDGTRSLSELAVMGISQSSPMSIRDLMATVRELTRGDWLTNDASELKSYGLEGEPNVSLVSGRIGRLPLARKMQSRILGRSAERLFSVFSRLTIGRGLLIVVIGLAAVLSILSIVLLSNKPSRVDDILWYQGKYSLGLLAAYSGAVFAFCLREFFRGAALISMRASIFAAGLAMRFFVIAPFLDDRHVFRAGEAGKQRLRLAGLAGTALSFGILLFSCSVIGDPEIAQGLFLAAMGSGVVFYMVLCPFVSSDAGRLIDQIMPLGEGRRHVASYFTRRILKRLGKSKAFEGELYLIFIIVLSIVWTYIGFFLSASAIDVVLDTIVRLPIRHVSTLDTISVWVVLIAASLVTGIWILAFVAAIVMTLVVHRPKRSPRPSNVTSDSECAKDVLVRFPVFAHLEDKVLSNLAEEATLRSYANGKDVIRQGDKGDTFFVVDRGETAVIVAEKSGLEHTVATLGPGDGFGELALIDKGLRTATVRAHGELKVVAIERESFLGVLERAAIPIESVTALIRATHTLLASDVFSNMAPSALARIVGMCDRKQYSKNEVIIREGEPGEKFYLIESGTVAIQKEGKANSLAELGPGNHFGEIALLSDELRSATVTATQPCVLLTLDRHSFQQVMTHDFNVAMRIEDVASRRAPAVSLVP